MREDTHTQTHKRKRTHARDLHMDGGQAERAAARAEQLKEEKRSREDDLRRFEQLLARSQVPYNPSSYTRPYVNLSPPLDHT